KTLVRAIDDLRPDFLHCLVAETELVHRTRTKILTDDVCSGDKLQYSLPRLDRLQVESEAFLVAVISGEKTGPRSGELARVGPFERLDLDHFGAEVGEDQPARRAHHHMDELDDADAVERQFRDHCQCARAVGTGL